MTKQDYLDWAEDYRRQSDILTQKIDRHRESMRGAMKGGRERQRAEDKLMEMISMRLECRSAMKNLLERAEGMKE